MCAIFVENPCCSGVATSVNDGSRFDKRWRGSCRFWWEELELVRLLRCIIRVSPTWCQGTTVGSAISGLKRSAAFCEM